MKAENDKKVVTERTCLAAALTLLVKAGEIDARRINEVIPTEGYEGIYNLLNARYKEAYDE